MRCLSEMLVRCARLCAVDMARKWPRLASGLAVRDQVALRVWITSVRCSSATLVRCSLPA